MYTILGGWILAATVMAAVWLISRWSRNAGVVDVAWGMGVALISFLFAATAADGNPARRILVSILILLWALRLSVYILRRVLTMPEDGRYETLKERWGDEAQRKLFWFFQLQAAACVLFALPIWFACRNPEPLGLTDLLGTLIWVVSIAGESTADRQLAAFRNKPEHRGQVCQFGLWRYSRHPNYFFEWLHWWSYVLFSVGTEHGWITLLGPAAMFYFVTQVTGIPPTEAQALRSRGDAYRRYQQSTNAFFPWWPRTQKVSDVA